MTACGRCGHTDGTCHRCGSDTPMLGGRINDQHYCHTFASAPSCYTLTLWEGADDPRALEAVADNPGHALDARLAAAERAFRLVWGSSQPLPPNLALALEAGNRATWLQVEVERLRDQVSHLHDQVEQLVAVRADGPAEGLLRYCDWPGCVRCYHAVSGPAPGAVGSPWSRVRFPSLLICGSHSESAHYPESATWTADAKRLDMACRCGARDRIQPTTQQAAVDWWQQHVTDAGDES